MWSVKIYAGPDGFEPQFTFTCKTKAQAIGLAATFHDQDGGYAIQITFTEKVKK